MLPRKTSIDVRYKGVDISPGILSWEYTDNFTGKVDDLILQIENSKSLWNSAWAPERGATLTSNLISLWGEKAVRRKLGLFEIDTYSIQKSPKTVRIESLSIPNSSTLRREGKNRAWEKVTLKRIATDIAKANKMKLYYDVDGNIDFDRIEQSGESDLSLLNRLTQQEGLALKISDKSIIILDEQRYEKMPVKSTIYESNENLVDYKFTASLIDVYRACTVKYQPPRSKKTISYTFTPKNALKVGRTLVVNKEVKSKAEAQKYAMKQLRQENKNAVTGTITIAGPTGYIAGDTINIRGFGKKFDGKYIITQVLTKVSGNTITNLSIRKCLEGY